METAQSTDMVGIHWPGSSPRAEGLGVKGKTMFKQIKENKGFTLIELMIVVAIIAILAVAALFCLLPASATSAPRQAEVKDIAQRHGERGEFVPAAAILHSAFEVDRCGADSTARIFLLNVQPASALGGLLRRVGLRARTADPCADNRLR